MSGVLLDWPRIHYKETGASPFLYYVVFGANVDELRLSRSKYRCDAIPEGLEIMAYGPACHPEVLDDLRQGYLWKELLVQESDLANVVAAQTTCTVVRGFVVDDSSLNYLRNTVGLITSLLDNGGVAIFDAQSFKWWSANDWKTRIFEPAAPLSHEHVVILVSEEPDDTQWLHTRGLRKFGRPDISIHNVPAAFCAAVVGMLNRFIEFQALGGVIQEGQCVQLTSLPEGMYCTHGGSEDDPDFNNFHIEIKWPNSSLDADASAMRRPA